jgi:branched-subunit amino acid transport protein
MIEGADLWIFIAALGLGTFGLRFVFLGLVGDRPMPAWLLRHLRYTAVALIPALAAPLTLWPAATGGAPDPARLIAAGVTLAVGYVTRNVVLAIAAGVVTLVGGLALIG